MSQIIGILSRTIESHCTHFFLFFSVGVHVSVSDVNEYPPEWDGGQSTVRVEIEEGQLLDHLIQVEAHDQDCSPKFGDICGYQILQSDQQPFVISKQGRNISTIYLLLSWCFSVINRIPCGWNTYKKLWKGKAGSESVNCVSQLICYSIE